MAVTEEWERALPQLSIRDGVAGYWFGTAFVPRMAGAEGDDDGDDDAGKDGKDDDADDANKEDDDFDKERALALIKRLRQTEKDGKAAKKELDAAQKRLKEIDDAGKSDLDKATTRAADLEKERDAALERATTLVLRLTVERAAGKMGFHDPDDAFRLLDRKAITMDDDGEPTNVDDLLKDLAKKKPHLVKESDDGGSGGDKKNLPATGKAGGKPNNLAEAEKKDRETVAASPAYRL